MAKAAALKAAKSDAEGFAMAGLAKGTEIKYSETPEVTQARQDAQKAQEAAAAVHGGCSDGTSMGDSGMYVQMCSYHNADMSWSVLRWYNSGTETTYLGDV